MTRGDGAKGRGGGRFRYEGNRMDVESTDTGMTSLTSTFLLPGFKLDGGKTSSGEEVLTPWATWPDLVV